jgi:hypothetical protein
MGNKGQQIATAVFVSHVSVLQENGGGDTERLIKGDPTLGVRGKALCGSVPLATSDCS